jgi:hypothetical protein
MHLAFPSEYGNTLSWCAAMLNKSSTAAWVDKFILIAKTGAAA